MTIASDEGVTTVRITGELDLALAAQATPAVNDVLRSAATAVLMDLRAVTFLDASGLALLLNVQRRLEARDRRLAIVSTARQPARVLELTGLASQLPLHSTVDSALTALRAAGD